MIYRLEDTSKVRDIFDGWEDTCVWSCQQKVMGTILVTDTEAPKSAIAVVGCFAFCAGEPDRELLMGKPAGFFVMVPENEAWSALLEECFPDCKRVTRYAIRKDTKFDRAVLEQYRNTLPDGCELRKIDGELYDLCLADPETASFVACFESKEQFLELGRGFVILRDGHREGGAAEGFGESLLRRAYFAVPFGRAVSELGCAQSDFGTFGGDAWLSIQPRVSGVRG